MTPGGIRLVVVAKFVQIALTIALVPRFAALICSTVCRRPVRPTTGHRFVFPNVQLCPYDSL